MFLSYFHFFQIRSHCITKNLLKLIAFPFQFMLIFITYFFLSYKSLFSAFMIVSITHWERKMKNKMVEYLMYWPESMYAFL